MWSKEKDYYTTDLGSNFYPMPLDIAEEMNLNIGRDKKRHTNNNGTLLLEDREYELEFLPSGIYRLIPSTSYTYHALPQVLEKKDRILDLKFRDDILKAFNVFKAREEVYRTAELCYKRGILLYGPPGTGKTTIIHSVIADMVDKDCLVLFVKLSLPEDICVNLKKDKRLKIIIFEEFTATLNHSYNDTIDMLDFLDGEKSLDNCFIIATTNYPEKIPGNFVDRPGRFDKLYKVDYINKSDATLYCKAVLKRELDEDEIKTVEKLQDVTIAQLREVILMMKLEDLSMLNAYYKIQAQSLLVKQDFTARKRIGFNSDEDD